MLARQLSKISARSTRFAESKKQMGEMVRQMRRRGIGEMPASTLGGINKGGAGSPLHFEGERPSQIRKLTLRERAEKQLAKEREERVAAARARMQSALSSSRTTLMARSRVTAKIAAEDLNIAAGMEADDPVSVKVGLRARARRCSHRKERGQTLEEQFGLEGEGGAGEVEVVAFRQLAKRMVEHGMDTKVRWALGLPEEMSVPRVAMRLLECADLPMASRLNEGQISVAMQAARALYDRAVGRSDTLNPTLNLILILTLTLTLSLTPTLILPLTLTLTLILTLTRILIRTRNRTSTRTRTLSRARTLPQA